MFMESTEKSLLSLASKINLLTSKNLTRTVVQVFMITASAYSELKKRDVPDKPVQKREADRFQKIKIDQNSHF